MKVFWIALAVPFAVLAQEAEEKAAPAGPPLEEVFSLDEHTRYKVKIVTELKVPRDKSKYEMDLIRLWHAIPTKRPWSETAGPEGASDISFLPEEGGRLGRDEATESYDVAWEITSGLEKGAELALETNFTVISCQRSFDTRKAKTSWDAFKGAVVELPEVEKTWEVPKEIVSFAEATAKRWPPHETMLEFCKWIDGKMEYDVRVDHENIESILDRQRGHSVHYVTLLRAMCQVAGIPARQVEGFRLTQDNGVDGDLAGLRPELTNTHIWAEVFFPEYGWLEVDPSRAPDVFEIPASYVQNNRRFQIQAIQALVKLDGGGQGELPLYRWDRGRLVSYFVEADTITFEEKRHKVRDSKKGAAKEKDAGTEQGPMLPEALRGEREWTDVEGRKMRAMMLRFADKAERVLVLRRSDGREFEFPVEGLSEKDRGFLLNALDGG